MMFKMCTMLIIIMLAIIDLYQVNELLKFDDNLYYILISIIGVSLFLGTLVYVYMEILISAPCRKIIAVIIIIPEVFVCAIKMAMPSENKVISDITWG